MQIDHDYLAQRREDLRQAAAERRGAAAQRKKADTNRTTLVEVRDLLTPGRKNISPMEVVRACLALVKAGDDALNPRDAHWVLLSASAAVVQLERHYQAEWLRANRLEAELTQLRADNKALAAVAGRPLHSRTKIMRDASGEISQSVTTYA